MKVKVLKIINIILISAITIWGIGALWGPFKESSARVNTSTVEVYEVSELVQLKLNIESSVGDSTDFTAKCFPIGKAARRNPPLEAFVTEAEYGGPLPLEEVGVLRLDQSNDEIILAPTPDQLIRFHVLANSDSEQDQALKRAVRDAILKAVSPRLAVSQSLDESRDILRLLSSEMEDIGRSVVIDWDKDYSVLTEYGHFSFPTKSYGSLVLPAGRYEALRVVVGEGQGSNWWCVLFPPLCFVDIEQSTAVSVDGKVGIPIKSEISDLERQTTEKSTSGRPKVRFFFWELLFKC